MKFLFARMVLTQYEILRVCCVSLGCDMKIYGDDCWSTICAGVTKPVAEVEIAPLQCDSLKNCLRSLNDTG